MKLRYFFLLAAIVGWFAHDGRAQDLTQTAALTTATCAPTLNPVSGSPNGSTTYRVTWWSTGFTGYSVAFQGSQDNSSFSTITTTALILEGSNPTSWSSSTTSNTMVIRAYLPYVKVCISSLSGSGTVNTLILGYKGTSPAPVGSGGSGPGTDVNATIVSPIGQMPMADSVAVAIASDQSAVPVTLGSSGTVLSGQQAVTGSAVALASHTIKSICVSANIANTINVYLGPSGITTSTGKELAPGAGACLSVTNSNLLFVIASTTGAGVSWIATN